jgi:hypothetical protein
LTKASTKGIEERRFLLTSKMAACSNIAKSKQDGVYFTHNDKAADHQVLSHTRQHAQPVARIEYLEGA